MRRPVAAILMLALFTAFCLAAVAEDKDAPKPSLPDGMKGFAGILRGEVVKKVENGFVLKVKEVVKVFEGNKAKEPKSAVGKELLINLRYEKIEGGKYRAIPAHVKFIQSLKVGEEISIEVKNDEGERLHILELSKEQLERGEERKDEPKKDEPKKDEPKKDEPKKDEPKKEEPKKDEGNLPKEGRIFGEVVKVEETRLWVKVSKTSQGCEALKDKTMEFFCTWVKQGDKSVPDPEQVKLFKSVSPGDKVEIAFYFNEHWRVKSLSVEKPEKK